MKELNLIQSPQQALVLDEKTQFLDWLQSSPTEEIQSAFSHFLITQKSVHTRRNYGRDISDFLKFCTDNSWHVAVLSQIKEEFINLWKIQLFKNGDKETSVARKLAALSSFLNFGVKRGLISKNVVLLVNRPHISEISRTNALTLAEMTDLLNFLKTNKETLKNLEPKSRKYASAALRYAVIHTLISVGMRVDELCGLHIGSLEELPDRARLNLTLKGGYEHVVVIHPQTHAILKAYIQEFRATCSPNELLFVRAQNCKNKTQKLTQAAVYQSITESARHAGITTHLSPHSCRATLATLLHNAGTPIGQIQDLLGHKRISTTSVYIKKAEERSQAAAVQIDLLNDCFNK